MGAIKYNVNSRIEYLCLYHVLFGVFNNLDNFAFLENLSQNVCNQADN